MKKGDTIKINGKEVIIKEVCHRQTVAFNENEKIIAIGTKETGIQGIGSVGGTGEKIGNAIKISAILVTAGLLGFRIYKYVKANKETEDTGHESEIDKNEGFSYSESQFKIWADALNEAFFGIGTDQDKVVQIIKRMQTKNDFYKLVDVYGKRTILPTVPFVFTPEKGDLIKHIVEDLADNKPELKEIKDHLSQFNIFLD